MFNFQPFRNIIKCNHILNVKYDPRNYCKSPYNTEITEQHILLARNAVNLAAEEDDRIHQSNLENIEFNNIQYNELISFMDSIGIKKTYLKRDTKSRARYPKYINTLAGYIDDVHRIAVFDDGHSNSVMNRNKFLAFITKKEDELQEYKNLKEKAENTARRMRESDLALVRFIIKYGLPDLSSWDDVEDYILSKDKYLHLASNMMAVRNDWNYGCGSVESSLGRFRLETPEDQEIYDNIGEAVDNFHDDPDGRIFRDIKYNYNVLFNKVDPEILKDYEEIKKYTH